MKKIILTTVALTLMFALLFVACQSNAAENRGGNAEPVANADETLRQEIAAEISEKFSPEDGLLLWTIYGVFLQYWEGVPETQAAAGGEFMRLFSYNTVLVLDALTIETSLREQMLAFIGTTIAEAKKADAPVYAQYAAALDTLAAQELSEEQRRQLRFVHANIDYAYNH